MSAAISEALTRYLDIDVAADVWDERPSLALIYQDAEGVVCFGPVPLGESVWGTAPPHQVVWAAGEIARDLHRAAGWSPFEDGETLLGLVLFSEGWGVTGKPDDGLREYAEHHRISDHPDRVEMKMVSAVLTDDSVIMLTHARGGKTEASPTIGVEGRIPDALRSALTAFQEVAA
jgi:hypothetical protein